MARAKETLKSVRAERDAALAQLHARERGDYERTLLEKGQSLAKAIEVQGQQLHSALWQARDTDARLEAIFEAYKRAKDTQRALVLLMCEDPDNAQS